MYEVSNKYEESEVYWDEGKIFSDRVDFLQVEEGLSEDEAIKQASNDPFLYELDYECIMDRFNEILQSVTSRFYHKVGGKYDKGYFYVTGRNLGWRGKSGFKVVGAENAQDLIREVLPNTQCTWFLFRPDDKREPRLILNNFHHDTRFSGMGGEWYDIYPMPKKAVDYWLENGYGWDNELEDLVFPEG